ncbi:cytochrome c oxidase, cbb3-type [Haloferula helveola]|uniref:Cytochrome c oxidase, cbb3-type n=1 Tax=Haloferula helveola TaxID=490095 RepID=A0ABM7RPQ9_9BACT|nr:cytochrome c oxidase, cbb3-type [Haloferula helveola]
MKYFFLAYAIIAALVIGLLPMRGEKRAETPLRLFPDMDDQDKLKAQKPDAFFSDGAGGRHPVDGTNPVGFLPEGQSELGGIPEYEFGGGTSYYATGAIEDYYSNGMPDELGLDANNVDAFLRRGEEVYNINCMPCHGKSGDGLGITSSFGVPGIANLTLDNFGQAAYPDGRLFDVISNGKGNMGAYKHNIPIRDRWAVVAYVRALQTARKAPLSDPSIKAAFDAATQNTESSAQ